MATTATSATSAYAELERVFTRYYRFEHLAAMAAWDQAAMMPEGGNAARGAALAEVAVHMHGLLCAPTLPGWFAAAAQEPLDDWQRASLHEMQRRWQLATVLPPELVEQKSLAGSTCEHAWRTQRPVNDWQGFLQNFRPVVAAARHEAKLLAAAFGCAPYEALMQKYEPGARTSEVERVFAEVKTWLPGLIQKVTTRQANDKVVAPIGPFPIAAQKALGEAVMGLLGFDMHGGRLDVSVHPFCGGVPEDVRITTRYREDDFVQSLMGVIHETGHARYEQGLPRAWVHLPVGQARSMGIHESQSLAFEMQLGRSRGFLRLLAPLIQTHFGAQPAFAVDNLAMLYDRVKPGFIRVDADEVTYPAHIILRFEIERALIEGEIEPEDIPALWAEKMAAYLGVDTRDNYRNGCLQDIHWTDGSFGYFPSYTLGAMYAAQYFATIRRSHPTLDEDIAAGNLAPLMQWFATHIWSNGSRWSTAELVTRATGTALDARHFRTHLEARYLG